VRLPQKLWKPLFCAKTHEEQIVIVNDVAFGGNGVARLPSGKAVFIPGVISGERVRIQIIKERSKFAEAKLLEVLDASPDRVAAPCPYFGRCGGCAYQHIAYSKQLEIKRTQVEQVLRRIGGFDFIPAVSIVPSPKEYGFRNRLTIHVENGAAGFFAKSSNRLVDVEECLLGSEEINARLQKLRAKVRRGEIQDGAYVIGTRPQPFFEQTNDEVAAALLQHAREAAGDRFQRIVDAYCGAGFFAQALAAQAPEIIGIEQNEAAIIHARKNAGEHERYIAADVAQVLGEILAEGGAERAAGTLVVIDPPAAGLAPRVVDHLLAATPARLLYVSCHPATLARDLRGLAPRYALSAVTAFDMFPQTAEIEVIAQLDLKPRA